MSPGGTMEDARKESLLEKVRKLLVQAGEDSGATEAERAAFEQRANALMAKYAIEEAEIWANQTKEERERPVAREMQLFRFDSWFEKYSRVISHLEGVCRVKVVPLGGYYTGKYFVAGYDADVRFFEMLWTSIHLTWISKLRPEWKPGSEHEDENVYNFVTAGYKWREIAEAGGFDWPDGGKLKRAYNRHCKKIGVSPTSHTQRHGAYRESFAEAFCSRLSMRLWDLENNNKADIQKTTGAEVALRDRHEDVLEMVYEKYPRLRPLTVAERAKIRAEQEELERKRQEAHEEWWNSLTPKQQERELEKQMRQQARDARASERYWEEQDRRKDVRGSAAGRAAADSVDLTGGRGNIGGAEREALS